MQSGSGSKLTNALKRFVQIIASYLGLPLTVKDAQGNVQDNALSVLLQDVAALFEEAKNPKDDTATDSFSAKMEAIHNMTTQDVFEALDEGKAMPWLEADDGRPAPGYRYLRRVHASERQVTSVISACVDERIFKMAPKRFRTELIIPVLMELGQVRIGWARKILTISTAGVL